MVNWGRSASGKKEDLTGSIREPKSSPNATPMVTKRFWMATEQARTYQWVLSWSLAELFTAFALTGSRCRIQLNILTNGRGPSVGTRRSPAVCQNIQLDPAGDPLLEPEGVGS